MAEDLLSQLDRKNLQRIADSLERIAAGMPSVVELLERIATAQETKGRIVGTVGDRNQ